MPDKTPPRGWSGRAWRFWQGLRGNTCWYVVCWPHGKYENAVVLRRTQYRSQGTHWVENYSGRFPSPIVVTPHDLSPQYAAQTPLYPYPDLPGKAAEEPQHL
ncbi:hypothetical protein ACIO3O_41890 [Streptomyces sp. NPDC087440]|uniref:hypothetical protein n=1 Tax=Streptomyces sp. NPDC087440 TaxID=3365790 RepID=UPI0037F61E8D